MQASTQTLFEAPPAVDGLESVDLLVREPEQLLARADDPRSHAGLVRMLLWTTIACCAVFGAAVGAYRGGAQTFYAALKLPLAVLFTAAAALPALIATRAALGRRNPGRDLVIAMLALARGGLVLGALAPVVLLLAAWGVDYHRLTLAAVACCGAAGVASLASLWRSMGDATPRERRWVAAVTVLALGLAGVQIVWTLRPWLVRPRSVEVPFVRSLEGSVLEAVGRSARSAGGIYDREEAPLPGGGAP